MKERSTQGPWSGLLLSQLLALAFLAGSLWWALRELALILPNDRVAASLSIQAALGPRLTRQLLAFSASLLVCHLLLGLAAFALARLTEAASPGRAVARRSWLVAGWFALMVALVMAANAAWHPASVFSGEDGWLHGESAGIPSVTIACATLLAVVLLLSLAAARHLPSPGRLAAAGLAAAGALTLVAGLTLPPAAAGPEAAPSGSGPHVVIIGVDSLRQDLTRAGGGAGATPRIDEFLAGAHQFQDATTPLARTYGSWVSILTGRHPVATNARVNLMPRTLVHEGDTLADALRGRGYRTVYATDEVRFANIDGSFGFDQLITPPVGAADFLLGYGGDLPLVNLIAPTAAGAWLFPSNHANRAAHVTYEPGDFVARLKDELEIRSPSLLAIHLTLAHWPYSWSDQRKPGNPQEYRIAYGRAVAAVDRQFGQVMRVLADKGVLENAVIVLLSDHGEALGAATDSMLRGTGTSREIWDSLWGHGTSVMSPHQYGVLLAMRAFGAARLPGTPGRHPWPVSLEDVRPTLEQLVTARAPEDVDGISLLAPLADPAQAARLASRIRFTETDFNTPATLAGRYEASGIIEEAAVFYELDPATGWVQFRRDRLAELLARKQRAAISQDTLLAAIPVPSGGPPRYLLTDRHNPLPRPLAARPDPSREPQAARLWDALQARFPGELPSLPGTP